MDYQAILIAFLALGIIGGILAYLLMVASKVLYVEEDVRVTKVTEALPGYNCGACGFPGCGGFADAIVEGQVKVLSNCKPGKEEHFNKIIEALKNDPEFKDLKIK